jgi:hypothetical protein
VSPSKDNDYNIMQKVGSFRGGKVGDLLGYLEGKTILTGHEVVQSFRDQAGFLRAGEGSKVLAHARKAPINKIDAAMSRYGGQYVQASSFRYTRPQGVSLWLSPSGQVIQIPFHLRNADRVIKALRLKNPVKYEGPEHSDLQTILNYGYARVQMHEKSFAADATLPLTGGQIAALRELRRGADGTRTFAGRVSAPNGEHKAMFDDYQMGEGALNKFIAESRTGVRKESK